MAIRLLVGIGNPGREYDKTRHNIGFEILDQWAKKNGETFRVEKRFHGEVAKVDSVYLLKPSTYVNRSGRSVRALLDYYKLALDELLVIVDDVDLPFGKVKMKARGSAGGHNGLKDIQTHLRTQDYFRLKVGIGDRSRGTLSDHVLGRFSAEETELLPSLVARAEEVIEELVSGAAFEHVMNRVNERPKRKKTSEEVSDEASSRRTGEIT